MSTTPVIALTKHASQRKSNRGISQAMIDDTIRHGVQIRKQGLRYFVMIAKSIPKNFRAQYKEQVENVVVIVTEDNFVMTVYKNPKALKNIKKKQKRLGKRKFSRAA